MTYMMSYISCCMFCLMSSWPSSIRGFVLVVVQVQKKTFITRATNLPAAFHIQQRPEQRAEWGTESHGARMNFQTTYQVIKQIGYKRTVNSLCMNRDCGKWATVSLSHYRTCKASSSFREPGRNTTSDNVYHHTFCFMFTTLLQLSFAYFVLSSCRVSCLIWSSQ